MELRRREGIMLEEAPPMTTVNAEVNGQCRLILLKRSLQRVPTVRFKGQGLLKGGGPQEALGSLLES